MSTIITCIQTTYSNSLDHYCLKKGIRLPGVNIKDIAFTTVQACKEECAKTGGCVTFVTVAGTYNRCFLKNKDHDAERAGAVAISARMSCYEGKEILNKLVLYKPIDLNL